MRDLYMRAQSAQQSGDLRAAAGLYREIVGLRPELAEAHANLGSIYYQIRDDDRARASLEQAIQLKPALAAPHFFLGVLAARQQDHKGAIRHLEDAIRLDPSNVAASLYLGEAYFSDGRNVAAADQFWKVASAEEFRVDAHYSLSRVYDRESESALEQLSRSFPRSFFLQLARGHLHEGRKDWKKAQDAYQAALELRPGAAGLEARLRWVSDNNGRPEPMSPPPPLPAGERSLLSMLYNPPPDERIGPLLRDQRTRLGAGSASAVEASELYEHARECQVAAYLATRWILANDPASYRARQLRGQLHEARGETDDAVREYREALRLRPALKDVHFAIGTLLWSVSRIDEALPELRAELRVSPNHPEAHYEIADILLLRGENSSAKEHLQQAIRFDPGMVEAHLAIERIYFAEGRPMEGLDHLRRAAELAPSDPTPHYRMSIVYRRLGEAEKSRAALERFQRLRDE